MVAFFFGKPLLTFGFSVLEQYADDANAHDAADVVVYKTKQQYHRKLLLLIAARNCVREK